ncbi:conserved hypothetical protein [Histoplasma capsulatum var. duboisii H88]|uniref:25S rRNA adenine-N(1) methyltransferase n=1 Tax=Ajellomyces capsulatus (strain H88) TaxID=544711 RepID=F0UG72_AJEC8|nr:conserved hypothetical protein [Histoplasma capsulatum var. duboisii H88]QSS55833.1 nucleolar protein [Histoplasma capsulatum var. duboisii H88]
MTSTSHSKTKSKRTPGSISHGRPPTAIRKPAASLSAKATRTLIRAHHQLHKARARALAEKNEALVRDLDRQIAAHGGLESYQLASKKGQSKERGGDSSKVLVEWLAPVFEELNLQWRKPQNQGGGASGANGTGDGKGDPKAEKGEETPRRPPPLRLLEVGALSTSNTCSRVGLLDVTRIDLHSQEKGILQQDFMERPLPTCDEEKFHIISLSLVLNYVSNSASRGKMLKQTTAFLTPPPPLIATTGDAASENAPDEQPNNSAHLPSLFLVLPAACVLNSRYFTEERLRALMSSLGYEMVQRKVTLKLVYYLWKYSVDGVPRASVFKKEILNPGGKRNNFTVTLD